MYIISNGIDIFNSYADYLESEIPDSVVLKGRKSIPGKGVGLNTNVLLQLILGSKKDAVLVSPDSLMIIYALVIKAFGRKLTYWLHEPRLLPGLRGYIIFIMNRIMVKLSDKIIVFSRDAFSSGLVQDHVYKVVLSSLPLLDVKLPAKDRVYISFIGNVSANKNIDEFIAIARRWPRKKFLIAGLGPLPKNLPNNIVIHNRYLTDSELYEFYASSICVILPYKSITQSGALITSLTTGTPAFVSNLRGLTEVLQPYEELFTFKSVDEAIELIPNTLHRHDLPLIMQELLNALREKYESSVYV